MSSESWPQVRLGDHVDLLTGFPFKSARFTDDPCDMRLVRGDNVIQGRFRWNGVQRWSSADVDGYAGYLLEPGDVVLAMDRPWIEAGLKYAAVSSEDQPCLLVQRVSRLRGINGLSTRFLRYVIGSRAFTEHILAVQTGTAVPHISSRQIADFRFALPPAIEQERIAHTLGALDDKIELNRRMNHTLESIARAIFKSWFVDFDPVRRKVEGGEVGLPPDLAALFPSDFEPSALDPIPKGWRVSPLGRLFRVGIGGVWGEDSPVRQTDVAVRCLRGIDLHDLSQGRIPDAPIRYVSAAQLAKRQLGSATLLVEGSGSFCGRSFLAQREVSSVFEEPLLYSNFCKRLDADCSPEVAVVASMQLARRYRKGEVANFRTGTAFPNLDIHGLLANLLVVVPPETVARAFKAVFVATRGDTLATEAVTLGRLRDALLPRLLDGSLQHAHQRRGIRCD